MSPCPAISAVSVALRAYTAGNMLLGDVCARTVEAYMATLQAQWGWLGQLTQCLQAQVCDAPVNPIFLEFCLYFVKQK